MRKSSHVPTCKTKCYQNKDVIFDFFFSEMFYSEQDNVLVRNKNPDLCSTELRN